MLPTIAIVGRPNVGKSTLFNVLTRSRDALVADQPGLTRDRQIGRGEIGATPYWLIDTGGLDDDDQQIVEYITQQAMLAVEEADCILFVVDGREGLTAADERIAQRLRSANKPVHIAVNKTESRDSDTLMAEFHQLGWNSIHPIAAVHRQGINSLMDAVTAELPKSDVADEPQADDKSIKVALVGRPNVGKSTLLNRILGYERVIAFDRPGTTRDSIAVPFQRDGQDYTLIDTAGVRRKAKVHETIEKFSVIKTLQSIEQAHVAVMLIDAREGMTEQDASLLGSILDSGCGVVIAVNKWDGLSQYDREQVRYGLGRKLHFMDFAQIHFISALHGSGVGLLFDSIQEAWRATTQQIPTPRLNQILEDAIASHPPPLVRGRRIKPRYLHQGGSRPPTFILHGNQVSSMPNSYQRYLINILRTAFDLRGTPIHLVCRQGENPFAGKRNTLTPRQVRQRQRLMKHVKKKKR